MKGVLAPEPETIDLIVGALYFHITTDPRVAHFFKESAVDQIMRHQRAFLEAALTGDPVYTGRTLGEAHAALIEKRGLRPWHFDVVMEHLAKTLAELGIDADLAAAIENQVARTKPLVFGKKSSST